MYVIRNADNIPARYGTLDIMQLSIRNTGANLWNSLPVSIKYANSIHPIIRDLKDYLLDKMFTNRDAWIIWLFGISTCCVKNRAYLWERISALEVTHLVWFLLQPIFVITALLNLGKSHGYWGPVMWCRLVLDRSLKQHKPIDPRFSENIPYNRNSWCHGKASQLFDLCLGNQPATVESPLDSPHNGPKM